MRINVRQTSDTEREILSSTSVDPEDLTVAGTVNVTGATSAKGSCGSRYFKGITPGDVIGQIVDHLRTSV